MIRICVLGNSHLGAPKQGWDAIEQEWTGYQITFYGTAGKTIESLELSGDSLHSVDQFVCKSFEFTLGGHQSVALHDYDAFLVYGIQPAPANIETSLSSAVVQALYRDRFGRSNFERICTMIRKVTPAPIFIGYRPLHPQSRARAASTECYSYADMVVLANRALSQLKITVLGQPPETITDGWATADVFAKEPIGIASPEKRQMAQQKRQKLQEWQDATDNLSAKRHENRSLHVNSSFGSMFMQQFLALLAQPEEDRSRAKSNG